MRAPSSVHASENFCAAIIVKKGGNIFVKKVDYKVGKFIVKYMIAYNNVSHIDFLFEIPCH